MNKVGIDHVLHALIINGRRSMKSSEICLSYGEQMLAGFIPPELIDSGRYLPLGMPPRMKPISNPLWALANAFEEPVGDMEPLSAVVNLTFATGTKKVVF